MTDRKKKLEEIKRRKMLLQQQLHQQTGEAVPDSLPQGGNATYSNVTSTAPSASQTRRNTKNFYEDSSKRSLMDEIALRAINKNLKPSDSTNVYLKGIFPETSDKNTQYEELNSHQKKVDNENKKDDIRKTSRKSTLRQSMDEVRKDEENERKKYYNCDNW